MNREKFFAYFAIGILFFIYRGWLKKEKKEGRGRSILHKDISGVLLVFGLMGALFLYFVN